MIKIKKIIFFIIKSAFVIVALLTLILFFYSAFFYEPSPMDSKTVENQITKEKEDLPDQIKDTKSLLDDINISQPTEYDEEFGKSISSLINKMNETKNNVYNVSRITMENWSFGPVRQEQVINSEEMNNLINFHRKTISLIVHGK